MPIIVVYGLRFERGKWQSWERTCGKDEMDGVEDSARAKAADRGRPEKPLYVDFLDASRYMFDIAYGPRENPVEGDVRVYAIRVDRMVIGDYEELKRYFSHM